MGQHPTKVTAQVLDVSMRHEAVVLRQIRICQTQIAAKSSHEVEMRGALNAGLFLRRLQYVCQFLARPFHGFVWLRQRPP